MREDTARERNFGVHPRLQILHGGCNLRDPDPVCDRSYDRWLDRRTEGTFILQETHADSIVL